jgi:hypothetical protein
VQRGDGVIDILAGRWFFVVFALIMALAVSCSFRVSKRMQQQEIAAKESFRARCEQVGGIIVPRNVGTFLGGSSYQDDCVVRHDAR